MSKNQIELDPITGEPIMPEEAEVAQELNNYEEPEEVQSPEQSESIQIAIKLQDFEKKALANNEEFAARLPKELPMGLKETLVNVPERMVMPVLCGVLPLAMAYASDVRFRYSDGRFQRLNAMSVIYGRQASGKSSVKDAVDLWIKPLKWQDEIGRAEEEAFKAKRRSRKANEKLPEEPKPIIRNLPITVSCSTLLKRLKNSQGKHLYSFGEELGTLQKTNGAGSWSSKYDIYRLSFDNGSWGQDYNSDQAESGVVDVAYNWSVLGTIGAVEKCFRADSVENGMCGRVMFAQMPSDFFAYMPTYKAPKPVNTDNILAAIEKLSSASGELELPRLAGAMRDWCDKKADRARKDMDVALDTLRKRAAVIGMRCGVLYYLLQKEQKETPSCINFAETMADYVLINQMEIFAEPLRDALKIDDKKAEGVYMGQNQKVFAVLPDQFTKEDYSRLRPDASPNVVSAAIKSWIRKGHCYKISKNTYQKTPDGILLNR